MDGLPYFLTFSPKTYNHIWLQNIELWRKTVYATRACFEVFCTPLKCTVSTRLSFPPSPSRGHGERTLSCGEHLLMYRVSHKRCPIAKIFKVDILYYNTFHIIAELLRMGVFFGGGRTLVLYTEPVPPHL